MFPTDLCQSTETECAPYYCGSPNSPTPPVRKPAGVNCQCGHRCTGEDFCALILFILEIFAEPFIFGDWTETEECSDDCFLKLERHCEPVVLPGLKLPSCNEQNTTMTGNTPCSPCEGEPKRINVFCVSLPVEEGKAFFT